MMPIFAALAANLLMHLLIAFVVLLQCGKLFKKKKSPETPVSVPPPGPVATAAAVGSMACDPALEQKTQDESKEIKVVAPAANDGAAAVAEKKEEVKDEKNGSKHGSKNLKVASKKDEVKEGEKKDGSKKNEVKKESSKKLDTAKQLEKKEQKEKAPVKEEEAEKKDKSKSSSAPEEKKEDKEDEEEKK